MTTTDPFALVTQLGILKYLADGIKGVRERDGKTAAASLPTGTRMPVMIAGTHAGFVAVQAGRKTANVTGEAAFLAWVTKHHPSEVVTTPHVRESFQDNVLKSVRERGGWPDKATGEVVDVPGVTTREGDPYPVVTLADGAENVIAGAWRAGEIDLAGMLALPAGAESDGPAAAPADPGTAAAA